MLKRDLSKNPFTKRDVQILERLLVKEKNNLKKYKATKNADSDLIDAHNSTIKLIKSKLTQVKKALK